MFALVEALRPKQWTKNLLVFAGILFSQQASNPALLLRATIGFFTFSLVAGTVYLLNDLRDLEADRLHPKKRKRPLASGRLPVAVARVALVPIVAVVAAAAWWLGREFVVVCGLYLAMNFAYSYWLKRQVLIDVFVIALGFVLRAIAGVELLRPVSPDTAISPWLLLCTFFGALFLGLGKRRREIENAGDSASSQRSVLRQYSVTSLDSLLVVTASSSLLSYALYTIWPATVEKFGTENLIYTVPIVAYGIFRYLHLLHASNETEDPSQVLLADRPLGATVVVYLVTVLLTLYLR